MERAEAQAILADRWLAPDEVAAVCSLVAIQRAQLNYAGPLTVTVARAVQALDALQPTAVDGLVTGELVEGMIAALVRRG